MLYPKQCGREAWELQFSQLGDGFIRCNGEAAIGPIGGREAHIFYGVIEWIAQQFLKCSHSLWKHGESWRASTGTASMIGPITMVLSVRKLRSTSSSGILRTATPDVRDIHSSVDTRHCSVVVLDGRVMTLLNWWYYGFCGAGMLEVMPASWMERQAYHAGLRERLRYSFRPLEK